MHPFARSLVTTATERALFLPDDRPLIALSGGPDSCALTHAVVAAADQGLLPRPLGIAHFHHGMRGADADADAAFCAAFATRLGLAATIGLGATAGANEAEARAARYAFLIATAEELGATVLVTAHTLDDQAETLLLRLLRGTSVDGLAGIPFRRDLTPTLAVVRPLRELRRAAVLAYCTEHQLQPRHDPTNDNPAYPRSRVRQLLPELAAAFNPQLVRALQRLSDHAQADRAFLTEQANRLWETAAQRVLDGVVLTAAPLRTAPTALVHRVLLRALWECTEGAPERRETLATQENVARLVALLSAPGAIDLPGRVRAVSEGARLTLWQTDFVLPYTSLLSATETPPPQLPSAFVLPWHGTIPASGVVRCPRPGDRLAGERPRKVSELLRAAGVPPEQRPHWPLLCDSATDTVLWVIGVAARTIPIDQTPILYLAWQGEDPWRKIKSSNNPPKTTSPSASR